ncbi:MAG: CZB domain-containing protein [Candidatus Omnitrophota bacterium]
MEQPIDFMNQLTEHIIWNVRLRCFLDGGACISEDQAVSSERCGLGQWLAREGLSKYGYIPLINDLDAVHTQMHKQVKQIIIAKNSGNTVQAEAGLIILQKISERVIELLTELDRGFDKDNE